MGTFLLILVVAVVNLLLGFMVALYMGRGPKHLSEMGQGIQFHTVSWREFLRWRKRSKQRSTGDDSAGDPTPAG